MSENTAKTSVEMVTSMGSITIELDGEKAPVTVENFLSYVKDGFYDGTIFHRVIDGFMIQGGGMDSEMKEKKNNKPIKNEGSNGLKNVRGSIAMARTSDPNSATSQFFINSADNDFLNYSGPSNPGYAVFGIVTDGLDVLSKINDVKTGSKGHHQDVPVEAVVIESVKVLG